MKKALIVTSVVLGSIVLAIAIPFSVFGIRSAMIQKDWTYLKTDAKYAQKTDVLGLKLVKQHVSCGYASIEMLSSYYGEKVSEDDLDARNASISTSTSQGFLQEVRKSIPSRNFVMREYLENDKLLKEVHESIEKGNPVAVEWAALYENEWTLHFSVVAGMDLSKDVITVYNPYGHIEKIGAEEFIGRVSFESYAHLPLFLSFGFAYGVFHKNTIFYAE